MATTYVSGVDGFDANTTGYNALVNKVYDWANRDIDALPAQIVRDSLRYAADTAYRTLRVPPLEATVRWNDSTALMTASTGSTSIYQSVTTLAVPADLIEFIHIRGTDASGLTTRVFNEKTDIRSFWDICSEKYNDSAFWSRQGNNVLLTPAFGNAARGFYGGSSGTEAQIEMFYYRRLPALNAIYDVTVSNFAGGLLNTGTMVPNTTANNGDLLYFPSGRALVTPEQFIAGNLVATGMGSATTENTLWFRARDIHDAGRNVYYQVTPANFVAGVLEQVQTGGTQLFFPAVSREDEFTIQSPQNIYNFTGTIIPDSAAAITRVRRNGVDITSEQGTSWSFFSENNQRGIEVQFATFNNGDELEVTYMAAPTAPTAGVTPAAAQNAQGTLTPFRFSDTTIDLANFTNTVVTNIADVSTVENDPDDFDIPVVFLGNEFSASNPPVPGTDVAVATAPTSGTFTTYRFTGMEAPHWLRDENEKVVLMGALAECFAYLQEDDQAQKYLALFQKEVAELNDEDRVRDASGGNIQTNYTAYGLI